MRLFRVLPLLLLLTAAAAAHAQTPPAVSKDNARSVVSDTGFGDDKAVCAGDTLRHGSIAAALEMLPMAAAAAAPSPPTLYLIGDSTVHNRAKGQQGWGEPFAKLWDLSRVAVVNRALGGRSSRSFLNEGLWAAVEKSLKPGDYVLIQFGHNDVGGLRGAASGYRASLKGTGDETVLWTDPKTGKQETVHTYGWYLTRYVRGAKAKGATAIVIAPVPRNLWSEDSHGKPVVRRAQNDYGKWAKDVAAREGTPFIDLNALLAEQYDFLGPQTVAARYFGPTDRTHTNPAGAAFNASFVLAGIRKIPSLEPLVRLSKPGSL